MNYHNIIQVLTDGNKKQLMTISFKSKNKTMQDKIHFAVFLDCDFLLRNDSSSIVNDCYEIKLA